jgi:flagellar biosynthesis/type III secretory pathway M-ring protein FliF/YscJ
MDIFSLLPIDQILTASPAGAIAIIFLIIVFKFIKPQIETLMKDHRDDRKEFSIAIKELTEVNRVLADEIKIQHKEVQHKLEQLLDSNKELNNKLNKIVDRIR